MNEAVAYLIVLIDQPYAPGHSISYKNACASSEDVDHQAQADQSIRCAHEDALEPRLPTNSQLTTLIRLRGGHADLRFRRALMHSCKICCSPAHIERHLRTVRPLTCVYILTIFPGISQSSRSIL